VNTSIELTANQEINAIAIGPDCPPLNFNEVNYYFLDNLLLATTDSFSPQISAENHPCDPDFTLSVIYVPNVIYQWYKEGIALVGETDPELSQNYGEGLYQVSTIQGSDCRLSVYDYQIPVSMTAYSESICEDETFTFGTSILSEAGIYTETFLNQSGCDSTVTLDLTIIAHSSSTVSASILSGESYNIGGQSFQQEGEYLVTLDSSQGCDSLVLLVLSVSDISIPNAFSPNGDGSNDEFFPIFTSSNIRTYTLHIYDRWGNLIYSGDKWLGTDELVGLYAYVVNFEFEDSEPKSFKGNVTLIR